MKEDEDDDEEEDEDEGCIVSVPALVGPSAASASPAAVFLISLACPLSALSLAPTTVSVACFFLRAATASIMLLPFVLSGEFLVTPLSANHRCCADVDARRLFLVVSFSFFSESLTRSTKAW